MLKNLSIAAGGAALLMTILNSIHPKPMDYVLDADVQTVRINTATNAMLDAPTEERALCVVETQLLREMVEKGARTHVTPYEATVVKIVRVHAILARLRIGDGFFRRDFTFTRKKTLINGSVEESVPLDAVSEFAIRCESFRRAQMFWPLRQVANWFWPCLD